jgi:hypothetical protein
MKVWIGPVLAIIRHYLSTAAVSVIKNAVVEAYLHDEWDEGEKTAFVIKTAEDFVKTTPTKADDLLAYIALKIYLARQEDKPKPEPKPEPVPTDPTTVPYTLIDEAIAAAKRAGDGYCVVTKGGVTGVFYLFPRGIGAPGIVVVWEP